MRFFAAATASKSTTASTKFLVGDLVTVEGEGQGTVAEIRGGGWYSVNLLDSGGTLVKCRGTRMVALEEDQSTQQQQLSKEADNNLAPPTTTSRSTPVHLLVDPGTPPDLPPPPPTIYDFDAVLRQHHDDPGKGAQENALVRQLAHHTSFDKWVVFTDLHCSPATLDTCLQVLNMVHGAAVERKAGVLFLGDFWHHRGTLRVDCLNAILQAFRSWTVPLVMIPGNHDQVTLSGHNHGLTPLENAFRIVVEDNEDPAIQNVGETTVAGPLVLSHPTVFRQALLIPYIRDMATVESVLQSPHAAQATALLVHAEVKGALMNDLIVSTHGIPPASFPSHKKIYSGHFHKPHVVQAADNQVVVEYLGSPYEVSLAEAQQDKHLAVLDASRDWECIERISLDVGKKHFKVSSLEELLELELGQHSVPEVECEMEAASTPFKHLRLGDRVILTIPKEQRLFQSKAKNDGTDGMVNDIAMDHINKLRDGGVMIEVRDTELLNGGRTSKDEMLSASTVSDEAPLEDLMPDSIWRKYVEEELKEETNVEYRVSILQAGLDILSDLESSCDEKAIPSSQGLVRDLKLTSISVRGFGPFRHQVTYPLSDRGLVLLRGDNNDIGSDSNGSGKTSLAMATLWALTGSLDARRTQDGKVADVVNDDCKSARVTLEGMVDGRPFVLSRTKTASKGELLFQLDGEELTTLSVKETQALVEEKLGVDAHLLSRTVFHGQHGMNDLLEATDAKLKDELSLLVPLGLWQEGSALARLKSRQARKQGDEVTGMIQLRKGDVDKLVGRLDLAGEARDDNQRRVDDAEKKIEKKLQEIEALLNPTRELDVTKLQSELEVVSNKINELTNGYDTSVKERDASLSPLELNWQEAKKNLDTARQAYATAERSTLLSTAQLETSRTAIRQLEQKWSVDLSLGITSYIVPPETCPTCQQPTSGTGDGHSHDAMKTTLFAEIEGAVSTLHAAEETHKASVKHLSDVGASLEVEEAAESRAKSVFQKASSHWNKQVSDLVESISDQRKLQGELMSRLSSVVVESQLTTQRDATLASVKMEQMALGHAKETYERLEKEVAEAQELLQQLESKKHEHAATESAMSDLGERFGQRGVQTYILQNAVDSLQTLAQTYLDQMSNGSLRLELSLDAGDKITRRAFVLGSDGQFKERPLSTLSGGQWRRSSLALTFGFAELVARKGRLRCSMCVLDEPLTHLDRSGRDNFGALVRGMIRRHQPEEAIEGPSADQHRVSGFGMSTIIIILQDLAAEELEEAFDSIDTVVKENGASSVQVDS